MNKDTVKGAAKQVAGSVESAFGKVTGSKTTELKGEIKKAAGKVQNAAGHANDGEI